MNKQIFFWLDEKWQRWLTFGVPAVLSFIAFIVYLPSLWYGFVFDDFPTITQYQHVRVIDFAGQFFGNPRWLSRLLNQVTYHFGGTNPFAYRIVNVLMHVFAGIMVFAIVHRLLSVVKKNAFAKTYALLISTMTTMLFFLHPIQTQTVTYITQMRLEGLVVLFSCAVLLTFVYGATAQTVNRRRWWYAGSFVLMAFAGGTKEIIVVLPVLLMLVDWFFLSEGDWATFKTRLWVHGAYCLVLYGIMFRYGFLTPQNIAAVAATPLHNNRGNVLTGAPAELIKPYFFAMTQFKILLHYLGVFFWPFGLCFDYDTKLATSFFNLDVFFPFLGVCALLGGTWWLYRKNRTSFAVFGLVWFLIAMLPRTSFFPATELICDYKTYPASFGMMLFLGYAFSYAGVWLFKHLQATLDWYRQHVFVVGSLAVLCCFLSVATVTRNVVWRSELDFWGDVISKIDKARGINNYAIALWDTGKTDEAIEYFYKAIKKDDWYAEPHVNLATIYQVQNNVDKALEHYKRALEIGEGHPELFNNLGMLHFANHSWDAAEYCLKEAVKLRPFYSKSHTNLGRVYQIKGKRKEALECYEKALKGDFQDRELYYLHGSLCFELGNARRAADSLEKLPKDYQDTAFLLGCCYYSMPSYKKAEENFAIAYQREPNNKVIAYNYAQALMNVRKYQDALQVYESLVKEVQSFPYVALHRVKCLYELGLTDKARSSIKSLLSSRLPREVIQDATALQKELKLV